MVAAESMEEPDIRTPRGIERAVPTEPPGLQGLPAERKPGETVGLPLRRSHAQLLAEVDRSTEVAAAEAVREARRDAAEAPGRHCELLPDQGPLWSRGGRQREHSHADRSGTRLQELAVSPPEGQANGRSEHR